MPWESKILVLLSAIPLFLSGWLAFRAVRKLRDGVRVMGKVVEVQQTTSEELGPLFAPVVEFSVDGISYRHRSKVFTGNKKLKIGDELPIVFPPGDPELAEVNNLSGIWAWPGMLFGFGLALLILAAFVAWMQK